MLFSARLALMRARRTRACSRITSRPTSSGGGAPAPGENGFLIGSMRNVDFYRLIAISSWMSLEIPRNGYKAPEAGPQLRVSTMRRRPLVVCVSAPDTDLDKVRDRFVGILLGLFVTAFVFKYIWPEHARIEPRAAQ